MSTGIEASVAKATSRVLSQLINGARQGLWVRRLRDEARPLMAHETAEGLLGELSPEEATAAAGYLASPDFEHVAVQAVIANLHTKERARAEHLSAVRELVRHGLRLATGLPGERLLGLTDVVVDAVHAASGRERGWSIQPVALGHHVAAEARNSALLGRLIGLKETHDTLTRLRSQVAYLHAEVRMPHLGKVRSVPWDQLYVPPALRYEGDERTIIALDALTEPGARHVILGDPGAGKSTFAEKLAHDLAANPHGTVVPLLVVLRNFSKELQRGERTLVEHLAVVGRVPYNVDLAADDVEYLLMSDRAVVILDGLDELAEVAMRRRIADLVKGFALLHPLVPIVATSRNIGYWEASLDAGLFNTCLLASFDNKRVAAYARRWFALDDGTLPGDRIALADGFLRESRPIEDLRRSPLLLSVLCAMYATDHYIPSNRAEVYERCALMAFEQWDRLRGIPRDLGFEGRVRGAVQTMAWELFTGPAPAERPRWQLLRILRDHLTTKGFDEDHADAVAAAFLDYCAGRAWILTEMGATNTEPIFGFVHRTFLEYFAAEHLVRRAPTPEDLWLELSQRVLHGEWDVVARLALQRIDRNVDDGGSRVIELALDAMRSASHDDRSTIFDFCVHSLGDVCVSSAVVRRIVVLALDQACALSEAKRLAILPSARDIAAGVSADGPLISLLYSSIPGNVVFIRQHLSSELAKLLEADHDVAFLLATNLVRRYVDSDERRVQVLTELQSELKQDCAKAFGRWHDRRPWGSRRNDADVAGVLDAHGVWAFYGSDVTMGRVNIPWVAWLLEASTPSVGDAARRLRELVLRCPAPWMRACRPPATENRWWDLFPVRMPERGDDLATWLVLALPLLELDVAGKQVPMIAAHLSWERAEGKASGFLRNELRLLGIPEHVVEFLMAWTAGNTNVVEVDGRYY